MIRIAVVIAFLTHSLIFCVLLFSLFWDYGIPPLKSYLVEIAFTAVNLLAAIGIAIGRRWGRVLSIGFFGMHALMSAYSDLRYVLEYNKPVSTLLQFAPIIIFFFVLAFLLSRPSARFYFAK